MIDIRAGSTNTKYNYDKKYIVNDDGILIGMDGEFNATLWSGGKALLSQRVFLLKP